MDDISERVAQRSQQKSANSNKKSFNIHYSVLACLKLGTVHSYSRRRVLRRHPPIPWHTWYCKILDFSHPTCTCTKRTAVVHTHLADDQASTSRAVQNKKMCAVWFVRCHDRSGASKAASSHYSSLSLQFSWHCNAILVIHTPSSCQYNNIQ